MLLNNHSRCFLLSIRRLLAVRSAEALDRQMKVLNDQGAYEKALQLFDEYQREKIHPLSNKSFTQALKACAQLGDLSRGSTIHHLVSTEIQKDSYLLSSLINLYMQCGEMRSAQSLFDASEKKTPAMYGTMMKGYIRNHAADQAIDLFRQIDRPNEIIINLLFNACSKVSSPEVFTLISHVATTMPITCHSNARLSASLIDALMNHGDVSGAQAIFDRLKHPTITAYGAMMKGLIRNDLPEKAIDLFRRISKPDAIAITLFFNACSKLANDQALNLIKQVSSTLSQTINSSPSILPSLFDALIKCADCSSAETVFRQMEKSALSYANLMNGFNRETQPDKTLKLFDQMKEDGIEPTVPIYLCLIKALAQISLSSLSEQIVTQIPKQFILNHAIQNALIDLWGKSGAIHRARQAFEQISQPDHVSYNAMIHSYGLNGMGGSAVELFNRMPVELIDEVTSICVLNACSHSGLMDQARLIFSKIDKQTEKISTTMVDCLSRAGLFDEAEALIERFESQHSPIYPMYMTLLSGARNQKNIDLSQRVFDRMKKLFPELIDPLISATILLANVYASVGEIGKASDIRWHLTQSGAKKKVGATWTSVNGQFFRFRAHDQSHPRSEQIYAELDRLSKELIGQGHQYDSSWITRPLNDDETIESALCGHSERLAIAWNFVENPRTSYIEITKNLRVCGDCHRATKLIALIRRCTIVVRDANRIHYFTPDGKCSCNDYF